MQTFRQAPSWGKRKLGRNNPQSLVKQQDRAIAHHLPPLLSPKTPKPWMIMRVVISCSHKMPSWKEGEM